jgi:sugar phosphate isomerase/epimerase
VKQAQAADTAIIGLSLPHDYLCGANSTPSSRSIYESFGPAAAAMELFRRHGVQAIEIRHFPETVPAELIVEGCGVILQEGLQVNLHPAIPATTSASRLGEVFPWVGDVLQRLAGRQEGLLLTMHGYAQAHGDEVELSNRTKALLVSLADLAERESAPVTFALELSRAKGVVDPANSYTGAAALCAKIDRARVGICWDWGHGYSNILKGSMEPDLPEAFLERVIHTHIHGVGPTGRTHWPLNRSRLPLAQYVAALLDRGYRGVFTLELSPERYRAEGPVGPSFLDSILLLKNALNNIKKKN